MLQQHDESPEDLSADMDKLYGKDARGKNPPALAVGRLSYVGRTFSGALVVKVVDDPNDLCVLCREEDLENMPSDRPVLAD